MTQDEWLTALIAVYNQRGYTVFVCPLKGHYRIGAVITYTELFNLPQPFRLISLTNKQDYDEETKLLASHFSDLSFRELESGGDAEFFRAVTE